MQWWFSTCKPTSVLWHDFILLYLKQNVNFLSDKILIMSNEVIIERKKPHFISTEFKAQRSAADAAHAAHADDVNKTSRILKALAFTALTSILYVILSKKQKENKKNKEALAYEVW